MGTLVIGMIVFFVLQYVTARLFAPHMPDRMITRRSIASIRSEMPKSWALWIGPGGSLVLSLINLGGYGRGGPAMYFVVQGVLYVIIIYVYLLNLRQKGRRG